MKSAMKLTTVVKVRPIEPQALLSMMENFNSACNWLSRVAFQEQTFRWLPLQRRAYYELRERFGVGGAQATVAVRKVAYAYSNKTRRHKIATFRQRGAIPVCQHAYKRDGTVRFYGYRVAFTARPGVALSGKRQAELVYRNGGFFLFQVIDASEATPLETQDVLGCDLGIVRLLTDSDGVFYSGEAVERARRRHSHRRRNLQRNGSRAAKRKLRSIGSRQARYQRDVNHVISKRVVAKAKDTLQAIALERLDGIRERITARRRQRAQHSNWAFFQLRSFVEYKAALAGVPIILVDPAHSSETCPECGAVKKANRVSQAQFLCRSCGLAGNADHIAALNIRARALGNAPMVAA
jgi:IS605 OrfB family transposase